MNSTVTELKTAIDSRVKFLEQELETAIAAHKWWLLAGLAAGLIFGGLIGTAL